MKRKVVNKPAIRLRNCECLSGADCKHWSKHDPGKCENKQKGVESFINHGDRQLLVCGDCCFNNTNTSKSSTVYKVKQNRESSVPTIGTVATPDDHISCVDQNENFATLFLFQRMGGDEFEIPRSMQAKMAEALSNISGMQEIDVVNVALYVSFRILNGPGRKYYNFCKAVLDNIKIACSHVMETIHTGGYNFDQPSTAVHSSPSTAVHSSTSITEPLYSVEYNEAGNALRTLIEVAEIAEIAEIAENAMINNTETENNRQSAEIAENAIITGTETAINNHQSAEETALINYGSNSIVLNRISKGTPIEEACDDIEEYVKNCDIPRELIKSFPVSFTDERYERVPNVGETFLLLYATIQAIQWLFYNKPLLKGRIKKYLSPIDILDRDSKVSNEKNFKEYVQKVRIAMSESAEQLIKSNFQEGGEFRRNIPDEVNTKTKRNQIVKEAYLTGNGYNMACDCLVLSRLFQLEILIFQYLNGNYRMIFHHYRLHDKFTFIDEVNEESDPFVFILQDTDNSEHFEFLRPRNILSQLKVKKK